MNFKQLTTILIFSLSFTPQKAMGMEDPDWWGAEIEGHPSIRISAPGKEILLLDLPDLTGLAGKISAPVVVIENIPEDKEELLEKFLKVEANVLSINGHKSANSYPLFDRLAKSDNLKLMLNSIDVRESPKPLIQEPQKPICKHNKNFFKEHPIQTLLGRFKGILNLISPDINEAKMEEARGITQWKMYYNIDSSRESDNQCIKLTRLRCLRGEYVPSSLLGDKIKLASLMSATTQENFQEYFKGFVALFNKFWETTNLLVVTASKPSLTIWVGKVCSFDKNDLCKYIASPLEWKKIHERDKEYNTFLTQTALCMDRPAISLNKEVLSLRVGSLKQLIEGNDCDNKVSYQLEFFAEDD